MSESKTELVQSQAGVIGEKITVTGGIHFHGHSEDQKKPDRSKPGLIDCIMCNRDDEDNAFDEFFPKKCSECPNHPQFYILPGEECQCHHSLVERLKATHILKYIRKNLHQTVSVNLVKVPWNMEGNIKMRQKMLKKNLVRAFDPDADDPDETLSSLSQRLGLNKYPVIVIVHDIYASKWDRQHKHLLVWYIREYWAAFECSEDMSIFLIFLNIKYPDAEDMGRVRRLWNFFSRKRIRKQMEQIGESAKSGDRCFVFENLNCLAFDELKKITKKHVNIWFDKYCPDMDQKERKEAIQKIFDGKEQVTMAEAEHELREITGKRGREFSGMHAEAKK